MEKIKDFFYNINDLIIALLIIAVASYIILWKVDDIMGYPEYAMAQALNENPSVKPDEIYPDTTTIPDNQEPAGSEDDPETGNNGPVVTEPEPQTPQTPETPQTPQTPETPQTPATPNQPVNKIEINIPSGAAGITIANLLKEKGLIDSTSAFVNRLSERKLDVKLRAGKFKIPENATLDEIINILTGQ